MIWKNPKSFNLIHLNMKCKDCGSTNYIQDGIRLDSICPDCWELRNLLVKAMPTMDRELFKSVQTAIANSHGSGRGANAMREALGLNQPEI
jgi:hypothetical protein